MLDEWKEFWLIRLKFEIVLILSLICFVIFVCVFCFFRYKVGDLVFFIFRFISILGRCIWLLLEIGILLSKLYIIVLYFFFILREVIMYKSL